MWNNVVSSFFRADVSIGQESTLSSILSALYIAFIFHIFKTRSKNHFKNLTVLFLSFINDSLFISQEKSFEKSNTILFCSYNIISLFDQVRLIVKHRKSEIFHFSRLTKNSNPFLLNLILLESSILQLKNTWKYLSFIFDRKLSFHQHIHFYSFKTLSIIKNIKMLDNSMSSLLLFYK